MSSGRTCPGGICPGGMSGSCIIYCSFHLSVSQLDVKCDVRYTQNGLVYFL